jgi:hypothetical protein
MIALLACGLAAPVTAASRRDAVRDAPVRGFDTDTPVRGLDAAAALPVLAESAWQDTAKPERRRGKGVMIGALVGAGAALIATGVMADRYGQNEGGRFCSRCMVEWSVITVPVGAGIGAAVGYGVDRARRTVTVIPVVSRRGGGVMVSAAF